VTQGQIEPRIENDKAEFLESRRLREDHRDRKVERASFETNLLESRKAAQDSNIAHIDVAKMKALQGVTALAQQPKGPAFKTDAVCNRPYHDEPFQPLSQAHSREAYDASGVGVGEVGREEKPTTTLSSSSPDR
jgi:hypothetical protein